MRRAACLVATAVLVSACGDAVTGPVTGGPMTVEIAAGDGQRGLEGEPLPEVIRVLVRDSEGLPESRVTVTFQVIAGEGEVSDATVASDEIGQATTRWRLGPGSVRNQRLSVRVGSGSATSEAIVVAEAVPSDETDVVVVHGGLGPLRGLMAFRSAGLDARIVQERRTADTIIPLQPQDQPGVEVIILPTANRPLWATHSWTPGIDTLHVTLQPKVRVDMVFHVQVGDMDEQREAIDLQLARTEEIWDGKFMGITVGDVTILDEIVDSVDVPVTSGGLCSTSSPTDAIDVTYVTSINGGQYDGWGCTTGVIFMSLHSTAYPNLLAHELGHTFALYHTPSGLMYGPNPGTYVWDGEILRAHFSAPSTLNTLFDGQPPDSRRYCAASSLCLSADYLLGEALASAPPALVASARLLHDGLRPGRRPLDGVEEEFVRPPRLPPELRPEPEQHHVP